MEGLPYDFGVEDKEEEGDDEDVEKKDKRSTLSLIESLKVEQKDKDQKPERPSKAELLETNEDESLDNAPELDTEAPLDYLSKEELKAIAQSMAEERLNEIQNADEVELTSETLAAESFLENIEVSGDVDQAYRETLQEIGENVTKSTPELFNVESETALPVDPRSLLIDAKNELTVNVSNKFKQTKEPKQSKAAETTKSAQPELLQPDSHERGIIDYLIGRRHGRIAANGRQEIIEKKLSREVSQLKLEMVSKETHVRQIAHNRVIENRRSPSRKTESETETIGRVLINSELPERPVGHRDELAGISAHTIKHNELLKIASAIKVEGSSLKSIYETHLVGEKGLRRIVAEYLRGGNYVKTLKSELIEKEKDFERDPRLRDQGSSKPIASLNSELEQLLQKSGIDWGEPATIAQAKAKSGNLPALIKDIKSPPNPLRRVADVILVGLIVSMAVVIIVLILTR